MNEHRDTAHQPAGDGELLSAYLDGDLDEAASTALERRLAADPALAAALERTRATVEELARLEVSPPEGYGRRLRQRLAAERDVPALHQAGPAATGGDGRSGRRAGDERGRWTRWSPAVAAASVVLAAVVGGAAITGVLGDPWGSGQDDAGTGEESAASAPAQDDAVGESGGTFDTQGMDGDDSSARMAEPEVELPVIADTRAEVADAEAARAHLSTATEVRQLLGTPLETGSELAAAYTVALSRAAPLATGDSPDRCLDVVTGGAEGPAVPARVEALTYETRPALAFVVLTASLGSDRLDRVEGWVIEPGACTVRLFLDLTPDR